MFEFLTLSDSTITGGVIVVFVLAFLRFGNRLVDIMLSYRSSPVDAVNKSIADQH